MSLSQAPGTWVWRYRDGAWWRQHPVLNIWDGPHIALPLMRKSTVLLPETETE